MSGLFSLVKPVLHSLDAEAAHGLTIAALKRGLAPAVDVPRDTRLHVSCFGLDFPNPVGLAAGFDKNATAIGPLLQTGFGFIEVGAATPRPQPGNPKPRLFRLRDDQAVINRFGFNNDGAAAVAVRLAERPASGVVGINLGANKETEDKAADFASVLSETGPYVDFATVNVSSPNTEKLRDLQGPDALREVLRRVLDTNAGLRRPVPIFLKVAPDLNLNEVDDIVAVALDLQIAGIFATNTTLSRDGLKSPFKSEPGGLSGAPLFAPSTRILAHFAKRLEGRIPLIGIGGITSAEDALLKIEAGATAVQLYSALVYHGISLGAKIARDMDRILAARDNTVSQLVGTRIDEFAV